MLSLPGLLKFNIFVPRTSKNQYFHSPDLYDFGGFWNLKWSQIDTKITSRNIIMLKQPESKKKNLFQSNLLIFHNSGIDFWRQNPSKINCKMTSKIAYLNLTHFGLKIRHKIPPRRSQDAHMTPQEDPRRSKTSSRRLQDASKTTPRRLPDASRYSQDAIRTALNSQGTPNCFQDAPRPPKTPPRRLQDASRPRFWAIFDRYLVHF